VEAISVLFDGISQTMVYTTVESAQGEWEVLRAKFCLTFFPIPRVGSLQKEVLDFKQRENESLGVAWAHLIDFYSSGPDLGIPSPILLQHFYLGLSEESTQFLDIASGGAFCHTHLSTKWNACPYVRPEINHT
jgi:hypothetical protein